MRLDKMTNLQHWTVIMNPSVQRDAFPSQSIDFIKGLFIIFIVLGHNPILSECIPKMTGGLYAFHVQAFFILPLLYPSKALNREFVRDRFVRYFVPFALWVSIASLAYLLFTPLGASFSWEWVIDFLLALVLGNAPVLKDVCGLEMYWFLPALMLLTLIRSSFSVLPSLFEKWFLGVSIVSFVCVGGIDEFYASWQVWSCFSVISLWPICLSAMWLQKLMLRYHAAVSIVLGSIGLVVALKILADEGAIINIARLEFVEFTNGSAFLGQFIAPIAAFITVSGTARLISSFPVIEFFGQHSLMIYLTHSLVFYSLFFSYTKFLGDVPKTLVSGMSFFVFTLISSICIAEFIKRSGRLRRLMTPRSWSEFKSIFRVCDVKHDQEWNA